MAQGMPPLVRLSRRPTVLLICRETPGQEYENHRHLSGRGSRPRIRIAPPETFKLLGPHRDRPATVAARELYVSMLEFCHNGATPGSPWRDSHAVKHYA